jgi:hypothetical protein
MGKWVTWELKILAKCGGPRRPWRPRVFYIRAPRDFAARLAMADYLSDPAENVDGYTITSVRRVRRAADFDAVQVCMECDSYGSMPHARKCKSRRRSWAALARAEELSCPVQRGAARGAAERSR